MALLVAEEVFGDAQDGAPRAGCGRLQLLPYWMGPTLSVLRVLTSSPAEAALEPCCRISGGLYLSGCRPSVLGARSWEIRTFLSGHRLHSHFIFSWPPFL